MKYLHLENFKEEPDGNSEFLEKLVYALKNMQKLDSIPPEMDDERLENLFRSATFTYLKKQVAK